MKYLSSRNMSILREMTSTDFKVRYQGSALGYLWSLLKPLALFAILYVVFTYILPLGKEVEHYSVYLLVGVVFWNFFTETTVIGTTSIVSRGDLIRKISIPRYLVVIASSISALINMGLSMVVVVGFAILNGVFPRIEWLLLIPLIIELYIFALGMALLLSTLYVKFRDVTYIWEIFLQAGFYASAIIFPLTLVPTEYHKWFFLNPIVQIIQDARAVITQDSITIWQTIQSPAIVIPFLIIAVIAISGSLYFKSRSRYFAEEI